MSRSIISPTTALDAEPPQPEDHLLAGRAQDARRRQKIGCGEVLTILENIRFLGYEVAMSRLVGGKPIIEIDKDVADARPAVAVDRARRRSSRSSRRRSQRAQRRHARS